MLPGRRGGQHPPGWAQIVLPWRALSAGSPSSPGTVCVIRWMESLVERAGATAACRRSRGSGGRTGNRQPAVRRRAAPQRPEFPPRFVTDSALPVFLLVALLIWLTSGGPVLYTQVRVGLDRRVRWMASRTSGGNGIWAGCHLRSISSAPCGWTPSTTRGGLGPAPRGSGHPHRPAAPAIPAGRAAPAY